MKKFTLIMMMGLLIFLGLSFEASAGVAGGPGTDPWPFGMEQPFPWKSIQGIWAAEINGAENQFIFKVSKQESRGTQLKIHQVNPVDCSLVAEGVGFEQNRIVRAQLMGAHGPQEMKIHVFRPSDLKSSRSDDDLFGLNRNVVVMTLAPLGRPQKKQAYPLVKLSPSVNRACE